MPIEVKNLSYQYARDSSAVAALQDVSFSVQDGEFVGIMGRTGCGKSTLIQLIAGLLRPTNGQILIDGADIHQKNYDRAKLRRTVGVVFQFPEYQLFETTVEKDVAFGLKHSGLPKADITARVRWALETVGFEYNAVRRQSPLSLSGGEKRRVAIAGVLAVRPRVLIFDEPIAGLDPLAREEFLTLTRRLNGEGVTVLMISHNTDFLCECAHRILVLEGGRLAADSSPVELFRDTRLAEKLHIGVGNVRDIAEKLSQNGFPIPAEITRYGELLDGVKAAVKGGARHG